jgi:fido (protein-threonine AMPylation protein)
MIQLKKYSMLKLTKRQLKIYDFIKKNALSGNKEIKEFLSSSNKSVSRVTIVRDIESLIHSELIKKSGQGRSVVYEEAIKNSLLTFIDPEEYFKISPDNREVAFERFNFEVFDKIKDDVFSKDELKELKVFNLKYQQRVKKLSSTLVKKEYERLSIELSWKSSQIEGNTYSLLDTEILIKENKEASGHTKEEAIMILNHKKTLDYMLDSKDDFKKLTVAKIENLHKLIVKDLQVSLNIRKQAVGITGTKYKPLDNQFQIQEALEKMVKLLNDSKSPPILKAFIAVLTISYIQPFEDGNKRTARLLGNAILLAHDYCPLSYRSVNEGDYKKAMLLFYEQNSARFFKNLFIKQFKFAVDSYFLV